MADEDSPRPFRRERNLSNRNFNKRGSRRRFSTESHSSIDSSTESYASNTNTTKSSLSSSSATTSATTTASTNTNTAPSSSLQISYSVNSDTENAFNRKSLLKMTPVTAKESETAAPTTTAADPASDQQKQTPELLPEQPQTPDPALLGVKQKVLRFETLQTEDRIIFKTGKYQTKTLRTTTATVTASRIVGGGGAGGYLGPLRVLPVFRKKRTNDDGNVAAGTAASADDDIDASSSKSPSASRVSGNSFHAHSIDEVRSEDEVDDLTDDYAVDDGAITTTMGGEYILPEEAKELKEGIIPSPVPGMEHQLIENESVSGNIRELGLDDFGKVGAVRRTMSADNHCRHNNATSLSTPIAAMNGDGLGANTISLPTSLSASKIEDFSKHSSEKQISEVMIESSSGGGGVKKSGSKDFPRNYRTLPRPKTEVVGTKNRHVVGKYNSLYQPKDDNDEEEEEIELRDKCDKFTRPILDELIKTEETYVENLLMGIENYGNIFQRKDLPPGLRGKKYVLLGNIEQIAEFHRDEFLPMLLLNRRDLKRLFDEFQHFVDQNSFYGYVIFTMNKQRSLKLCDVYKNYFKLIQSELDDKLGINSFLVQPIQRMARYPLLLQQFISTLFKHRDFVMKPLIESCCRLEKKMRTLLTTTNESEVINDIADCNEFNVFYQGKFRKVSEFHVFDHTLKRTYRSKVFIFDKCIIYTEIKGKHLVFHGRYPCEHIGILAKTKSFTLFYERRKQQECDFNGDPALIEMWLELIRDMINCFVTEERQKLQERYSRENDHLHRKPPSLSLFRDSNRFSSDSGIGNIWVMPKPETQEDAVGNRTTWYAVS